MRVTLSHVACLSLLGASLPAACLVKDFELTNLPAIGGDGAEPSGGKPAGGSSNGGSAHAGDDATGGEPPATTGGAAVGGDASGGHGGVGGNDGGSPPVGELPATFPRASACGQFSELLCDDFESSSLSTDIWKAASAAMTQTPAGPVPSGTRVLNNAYQKLEPKLSFPDTATLSFWVRFSVDTDHEFVTFRESESVTITFGRESRVFRFRRHVLGQDPPATAPTDARLTLGAPTDTWACIELRVGSEIRARVLTFADQVVDLPVLDSVKTPGADEAWITEAGTGPSLAGLDFWFGDGNAAEYDEVLLTPDTDGMSVCQYYLAPP